MDAAALPPRALLRAHPGLAGRLPLAGLLRGPTPVQPLGSDGVFVKRDDLTAGDYGGNKVRKLDFILGQARARGVRELIAFGYAGSNFVAATAWHAHRLGLHTTGLLLPQAPADYCADNLAVGLAAGADLQLRRSSAALVRSAVAASLRSLARGRGWPLWIPPGGSSPLGALGFVDAALELVQQVDAGALPRPQRLYVAFSSMGTVAGLAVGLALAGWATRIVAVQVVGRELADARKLGRLIHRIGALLRQLDASLRVPADAGARVDIRTEFYGPGYAEPTPATLAAITRFRAALPGARVDGAYSGKALAALYHDLDAGSSTREPVLYWHTFSAQARPAGVERPPSSRIPAPLRPYFAPALATHQR